jgi:uncharacterized RmlC-like cupin family protein
MKSSVYDCSIIELSKIQKLAGNITVIDNEKSIIPFNVKRVFYIYDIPGGVSRGAHAHKECEQFLIAASGALEVSLDDGNVKRNVLLNRPYNGLYIPPKIWAQEVNFSSGAICLVLTSHKYNEEDYIRSYNEFIKLKK